VKSYAVYWLPPKEIEAIRTGFSWPALLLGIIWLIIKKLWMITALWITFFILLIISSAYAQKINSLFLNIINIFGNIGLLLLPGFKGNDWLVNNLKRRGYIYIRSVDAESPEDAIKQVNGF
jgi:hypothetical protein